MHIVLLICCLLTSSLPAQDGSQFTAVVGKSEASFSLPVQQRMLWRWNQPGTPDNAREYRMDMTLKNEGKEYNFGFYLWKHPGASPKSGSFTDLLRAGQKSLFEPSQSGRMTIVRDANVKVKTEGDRLVITVHGDKDLERLFSSRPTEVIFKIKYPHEAAISQTVPIVYQ
ncbi:MAG TPA: hypothetical protein VF075_02910 [Pyrinomonadaceae bacterium]